MSKGALTRNSILSHAGGLATRIGLEGLTIGRLADDLQMSKSGLFAHFRSKEELQLRTIESERDRFIEAVVKPVLREEGGEARIRALLEKWLAWRSSRPGGCFFAAASFELDDRPGPVRERLAAVQREWLASIGRIAGSAVARGFFRGDLDTDLFAHEFYGLMLSHHLAEHLLDDPKARSRVERSFEALVNRSKAE